MILGYSFIITLKLLEKQKVAITLVKQEYKSTEKKQNYRTGLEIIYEGREVSINIVKDCRKLKKEKKYYKYNKVEYPVKGQNRK